MDSSSHGVPLQEGQLHTFLTQLPVEIMKCVKISQMNDDSSF